MRKPTLPSRPRSGEIIQGFTPTWINKLLDCIAYAMSHPLADGSTTRLTDAGVMQAIQRPQQSIIPAENNPGSDVFFARPWAKNETYSSEEIFIYNADVFATCQANSSPDSNQLMYIPYWVTPYEIDFTASSPVITACIKSDITLPVPDDAPAGTEETRLSVYVPIDNSWVIR